VLAACAGASGAAEPLRLEDALARAGAASPAVRAAALQLEAARARRTQAGLVPSNPVIAGEIARHTEGEGGRAEIDRGVSLAQEIEVGGQRGLRVTAADHELARAELVLADRRRTVEAEVRRAFAGLTAAERRGALATETAELADRLADAARSRARAGDVGQLDVQLAEIEAARAAQALATADAERVRATGRLAEVLGAEPWEALAVAADEREPAPLPPEEELVARALATRPDLAAAREERARLDAEAALVHRRARVPNPTVRGFYRQELREEHIAGGEVSVPLPVWNRDQGTEAALRAAAGGAGVETDRLAREIPRQVHLALVRRAAAAAAWTRYRREALPAAAAARDLVERGYAGGYLGLPEALVQRDRLLQVRGAAVDAWLGLREAEADLIEAVGAAVP